MDYSLEDYNDAFLADLEDALYDDNSLNDYGRISWLDLGNLEIILRYCVIPSIDQTITKFFPIVLSVLLIRLVNAVLPINHIQKHLLGAIISLILIFKYFSLWHSLYLLVLTISACSVLTLVKPSKVTLIVITICGSHMIIGQLWMETSSWMSIRGAEMILVMKIVSLGFEISSGQVESWNPLSVSNYLISASTSIIGTWVSFGKFSSFTAQSSSLKNFEFKRTVKFACLCLISLCLSNCLYSLIEYLVDENLIWSTYFKAFSFRQSHYFISYFCQFICAVGSIGSESDSKSTVLLTRQSQIELPWSLVHVVTNWNLTMHLWLKKYVFMETKKYGTLKAILATYFVSSMLHGFDINISLVLFSLGLFTYSELNFRQKLTRKLNGCVKAKDRNQVTMTRLVNLLFLVVNIWHLAYLGQLFYFESDNPSESVLGQALGKWSRTLFSSHIIVIIQLVISKLL